MPPEGVVKRFFLVSEWNNLNYYKRGIGFVVSKKWSPNIISSNFHSSRVGVLLLRLDSNKTIKIVQVYAPTSPSDDDEVEEFYHDLESTPNTNSTHTVVMGDFNAKLGRGRKPRETFIGGFGIVARNERGDSTSNNGGDK